MSDLAGKSYRVPGEYRMVFEHKLRELVASLPHLPDFARDQSTADEVLEVIVVRRPAPQIMKAG